jgi:hypothetical protein
VPFAAVALGVLARLARRVSVLGVQVLVTAAKKRIASHHGMTITTIRLDGKYVPPIPGRAK